MQHTNRPPLPSPAEIAALPPDGGAHYNRLIFEQSPYLLQHAANPVDWHPWGEEAFRKARDEQKPIFLSVGYATCHWCHVMEHESFEDDEVAARLNEVFVCVKVDREERPDIDHVYMTVTQAMTGRGGWPMTVIMTPDRLPFFAGTYFPRGNMLQLIPALDKAWREQRDRILASGADIAAQLQSMSGGAPGDDLGDAAMALCFEQLAANFDPAQGGFGTAPKFPVPHNLLFLLHYHRRSGRREALEMVEHTLASMRRGGVYDHVGFGFHRYATDAHWLVPHFEKMLYDQALHVMACLAAWQVTANPDYARTAREILTYVLRDMTAPEGGFFSAEDADSEGEEGRFYVWTPQEVRRVAGAADGQLFCDVFAITPDGNFHDEATHRKTGASIPHLRASLEETATRAGVAVEALRERLEAIRRKLFAAREERVHPLKDDKILTDWNGLMIGAAARAGQVLDAPEYVAAARRAADFALTHLRDRNGRLLKRSRGGVAGLHAHLEDYAFMVLGLTDLYEATFEPRYLREALALNDMMVEHFWDEDNGGLFLTSDDAEKLLVRSKEIYDGALPSGNSVAALNLARLARLTGRTDLATKASATVRAFSANVARHPTGHTFLLLAVDFLTGPTHEIVVTGHPANEAVQAALRALRAPFAPNKVVLLKPDTAAAGGELAQLAPYTAAMPVPPGAPTVYLCRNFSCDRPTTDIAAVAATLAGPAR